MRSVSRRLESVNRQHRDQHGHAGGRPTPAAPAVPAARPGLDPITRIEPASRDGSEAHEFFCDFGTDEAAFVWVRAADLLDYRRFQRVVLRELGRLYRCPQVEAAIVERPVWLGVIEAALTAPREDEEDE